MIQISAMNHQHITTTFRGAIAILFAGLAVVNVLLIRENKRLWAELSRSHAAAELQPGASVPALSGLTIEGASVNVNYASDRRKTVLFVFSNECSVCKANWPTWSDLVGKLDPNRFRVI